MFFDNLQVVHTRSALLEETHYYPFGLIMAGISSKAINVGLVRNQRKFNGMEYTEDFDLNTYDALFRNGDPQIARWKQIDPKPNIFESPYSMMGNNPIMYSDPLGDTTFVYNLVGKHLKTIDDNLPNQVHFVRNRAFKSANFKKYNTVEKQSQYIRQNSEAFIGSNTINDAKKIESHATAEGVEIGFVGIVGKDREIRLKELPIESNNKEAQIDKMDELIDKAYPGAEAQSKIFLVGHVHHGKLETPDEIAPPEFGQWFKGEDARFISLGRPSSPRVESNGDFGPYLYRSPSATQRGQSAAMILTPYGFTIYGTAESSQINPYGGTYLSTGEIRPELKSYFRYTQINR